MTNAIEAIQSIYDLEDLKEIVRGGCQSGVCFQHIYTSDTVKFFDTYEDEIVEYISDAVGEDQLVVIFKDAYCNLRTYKNNMTWAFIELVAGYLVDEYESTTCEELDDEPIKLYADYSKSDVELLQKKGFNPVNSEVIDYGKGRLTSANSQQTAWYSQV